MRRICYVLLGLVLLISGCQWSDERADDIYWKETYEDLQVPDDEEKLSLNEKKERVNTSKESALEDGVLTLPEAFRLGLKYSEGLHKQAEQQFQREAQTTKVIATILPQVKAHASWTEDSQQVQFAGTPRNRFEYYGTVDQTIFSGEFLPALESNKFARKMGRLELKKQRNQLLFQIASRFYRILQIQEDIRALRASLERVEEFRQVVEAQREAGTASRDDLLLARSRHDEIQASLVQRRHDKKTARTRLATLIDLEQLPSELREGYTVSRTEQKIPTLVQTSFEKRHDLQMSKYAVKRARAEKNRARAAYLPDLNFRFTHHTDRVGSFNGVLDYTLFFDMTWTLFDGLGREADMAQAYSQIRQNKLDQQALHDEIRGEVKEAVYAYRSLNESLESMRRRMNHTREAVDILKNRFEAGEVIQLEVLEAEEAAKDAERAFRRSALARKLSALRIRLATGTLEQTDIVGELFNTGT